MTESCRTCKNWTNWKKTNEAISDALSKTPTWDAKTAVLGRCTITNKMTRGDTPICDKYIPSALAEIEMKAAIH